MKKRRFVILLAAVLILGGCKQVKVQQEPITKSAFLLDTFVNITLYDSQDAALLDGSLALCREYEELLSKTIETSEIARMNHRDPETRQVAVSEATAELIQKGLEYANMSHGSFDITIEPVSALWDFNSEKAELPDPDQLADAVEQIDYQKVSVKGNTIIFESPETRIELGAIAKGYIADQIKEYLVSQGVKSAIINLGGNVLCIGEKPDGTAFNIGLQKPFKERNETSEVLEIRDQSVVTSGVYERCFEKDGVNYHHILDPKNGYPYQNGLLSVTIVSPQSVDGDGLSTACFSLGLEEGIALVDSLPEVYGYFMTDDYKIYYSEGAEELLK